MKIPLVDLVAQNGDVADEIRAGWEDVLATGSFIGGPAVEEFEASYARFIGVDHCIGVANGTDAIEMALRAVGVESQSEVILPANSFVATAEAVARIGAVPVLVDVDPVHSLIDPEKVAAAITSSTRAIVPVHLYGQTAPVEALLPIAESCGAVIVEDAAQSQGSLRFGRQSGSLGTVAATSFYPGKNLGAAGDAGAVLTNDPAIAQRTRMLGGHGSRVKYIHDIVGFNSRLDALQAVVLSAKLRRLTEWNRRRRDAAALYHQILQDFPTVSLPVVMDGNDDVWHLYVVRVPERDTVLAALQREGIGAAIHYPVPIHLTGAFSHLSYGPGSFPVAEQAAGEILSLPLYPHIAAADQHLVADRLRAALATMEAAPLTA
ncbi:DegT/DnrJ/EryC1/StrS family aminotransferase [Pelagibacterium sp. H642]|uniref:DegT/DnrJ/EryC1/StrS family aminotransferase n=1 Tax=Pelagibacterium sp. H642 TaxID=1881069 RepID=UPI002816485F|nr:DegT/DnrJ/EryC1/StrS family aminotransferase [Pelagibacterium sp. H642]WMT92835.1 DegT/DnrJ/EryC1/StrS family aminotransferase [Pelagibacterium sp. H642]